MKNRDTKNMSDSILYTKNISDYYYSLTTVIKTNVPLTKEQTKNDALKNSKVFIMQTFLDYRYARVPLEKLC